MNDRFPAGLAERLAAIVGERGLIAAEHERRPYETDWRDQYHGRAAAVVRPANTDEVARVVALLAQYGIAMVPQGGNTSLCGASVPDASGTQVVINLSRMNRVRAVDAANNTMTVEAGCVLESLQQVADAHDRLFPLSLGAQGSCEIGGNLSTNAGGTAVLRYGNTRELVLGLEVVLPDGRVWNGLRGLRKDNTGYELLARVCVDLVLKHMPGTRDPLPARHSWYVLVELSDSAAGDALGAMLEESLGAAAEESLILDAMIAASQAQRDALWQMRENVSEAQKQDGVSIKHDVAVPVSSVAEFIARADAALAARFPDVRIVAFGHVGDGNIHYNCSKSERQEAAAFFAQAAEVNHIVYEVVNALGGSISAEHGLGVMKREEIKLYKSPLELEMMRSIKNALDPHGLMNPGKVL